MSQIKKLEDRLESIKLKIEEEKNKELRKIGRLAVKYGLHEIDAKVLEKHFSEIQAKYNPIDKEN